MTRRPEFKILKCAKGFSRQRGKAVPLFCETYIDRMLVQLFGSSSEGLLDRTDLVRRVVLRTFLDGLLGLSRQFWGDTLLKEPRSALVFGTFIIRVGQKLVTEPSGGYRPVLFK